MSESYCELCGELLHPLKTYIHQLNDDHETVEYRCHKKCSDELKVKVSNIEGWRKLTVKKILSKLNL